MPGRAWLRFLAVVAGLTALPVIGFGVFFLLALASERSWHPAFEEAIAVPLTWLGSILLPICVWRLLHAARSVRDKSPHQMSGALWPRRVLVPVALLMLAPIVLIGGAMILYELTRATRAQQARAQAALAADAAAADKYGPVERVALFSPEWEDADFFGLKVTLTQPRYAVLAEFQYVDEQHSVSLTIPQLSFYFVSPDALDVDKAIGGFTSRNSNVTAIVHWAMQTVAEDEALAWSIGITEGEGAWSISVYAQTRGAKTGYRKIILAGIKPFTQIPGMPDNTNHGGYLGLDPKTVTWTPVPPERPFWGNAGNSSERSYKWHSLPLFEASDKEGRIVAHMRVQLLACPLQGLHTTMAAPILRHGDWRKDEEMKSLLGTQAPASKEATNNAAVTNQQQFFFVHGRVTDEQGNGLPGVTVAANCGAGTLRRTGETLTDDNGSYILRFGPGMRTRDETSGKWGVGVQAATIHPAKSGYFDANLNRQGDLLMADRVPASGENVGWKVDTNKLVLPGRPFPLNFVMLPAATIEGELHDEKGAVVPGWAVCLSGENLPPSSSVFTCVDSDEKGYFSVKDAPTTGRWWLEAYRHADRKRNLPASVEFRSERFTLAEPGKYQFKARLDEADPQHHLKIEYTGPQQAKNSP